MQKNRAIQGWLIVLLFSCAAHTASASIAFVSGQMTASTHASTVTGGSTNHTAPPVIYSSEMGVHTIQSTAVNPAGNAIADILMSSMREPDLLTIDIAAQMSGSFTATVYGQSEVIEVIELSEATTLKVTAFHGMNSQFVMSFRLPGSSTNFFATASTATRLFDAGYYEVRGTFVENGNIDGIAFSGGSVSIVPEPGAMIAVLALGSLIIQRRPHRRCC
jgi:hypothetical protein